MRLAIDLMGAETPVDCIIAAVERALEEFAELEVDLVGDESVIRPEMTRLEGGARSTRAAVVHADQAVEMTDRPSLALRHKRGSSMYLAVERVQTGLAAAALSCGNTGALMGISRHLLKTLPGIDRPAIIKAIPSREGRCYVLDLGANLHCDAENLIQFAAMGSIMCTAIEGIERPRIGLLNIGEEEMKGSSELHLAASLLRENSGLNFIGYVEGDAIFQSDADVIVCDGWVGNVALKTSEGLAKFVSEMISDAFDSTFVTRAAGVLAAPILHSLREKLNPEKYNGASMLGLQGIVVKSHGNTSAEGFYHAICQAIREVEQDIPSLINRHLDTILNTYH